VADLDAGVRSARIFLAAPYALADLLEQFSDQIVEERIVNWDGKKRAIAAHTQTRFGALILKYEPLLNCPREELVAALLEGISQEGIDILPWDRDTRNWQARVLFLRATLGDAHWPDVSDAALLASMEKWFAPFAAGINRADDLKRFDLTSALRSLLSWRQQKRLGCTRADASHGPKRLAHPARLRERLHADFGCARAGNVWRDGNTAHRRRRRAGTDPFALACRPAGPSDTRPCEFLAHHVSPSEKGSQRPLSKTPLARRSVRRAANQPRQTSTKK